jgi:hypothetical protein
VRIDATSWAAKYIQQRGGRLYVWFDEVGATHWTVQQVRFDAPDGVNFIQHHADGFDIYLQADFSPPTEVQVRRRPWPLGPIEVTGTGAGQSDVGGG